MLSRPSQKLIKAIFLVVGLGTLATFPEPTKAQSVDEKAVQKMISEFQSKGILNEEQAQEVRVKIKNIPPEKWKKIEEQAARLHQERRAPAQETTNSVDAAAELIDTNSPEFKKTMERMKAVLDAP